MYLWIIKKLIRNKYRYVYRRITLIYFVKVILTNTIFLLKLLARLTSCYSKATLFISYYKSIYKTVDNYTELIISIYTHSTIT